MNAQINHVFTQHPRINSIMVTREGEVFSKLLRSLIEPAPHSNSKELFVNEMGKIYFVNSLVCETFNGPPKDSACMVKHLNHDRHDVSADNLEWITIDEYTQSMNSGRGNRSDDRPVYVKDLETDEIIRFPSLQKTAAYFKCNGEKVHRWLRSTQLYPFTIKYDMRYEDTNFKGLNGHHIGKLPSGVSRKILLIDKVGNFSTYGSLGLAANEIGCHKSTIERQLRKVTKVTPLGDKGYIAHYLDNYDGELPENIPDTPFVEGPKVLPVRKPTPISVEDLLTGKITHYKSSEEFAKLHGFEKSTIQKATGKKNWRGMCIKYIRAEQVLKT